MTQICVVNLMLYRHICRGQFRARYLVKVGSILKSSQSFDAFRNVIVSRSGFVNLYPMVESFLDAFLLLASKVWTCAFKALDRAAYRLAGGHLFDVTLRDTDHATNLVMCDSICARPFCDDRQVGKHFLES